MCGLVGLVSSSAVNQELYDSLTVLQHRGQDAAGIITTDGDKLFLRKDNGLVLGALITAGISSLVRKSPLSGIDRSIGAGFGLARGVLLATVLVWLVGLTPARQDPWWRGSLFIGKLEWLASGLNQFVPDDWQQRLKPAVATAGAI